MLKISYTYKNLAPHDKDFLKNYLPKKLERFENLMKRYEGKDCRLEVKAEKFATKSAYMVELVLHIPKYRFSAREDDHTIIEALDLAVDKLITQLRKLVNKN